MLYAHFTNGSKKRSAMLTLSETAALSHGIVSEIPVSGRREARAIAMARGAKPHNF